MKIAYGSAYEAENWAIIVQEANIGNHPEWSVAQGEAVEVQRMLATMMKRIREHAALPRTIRESPEPYSPWTTDGQP